MFIFAYYTQKGLFQDICRRRGHRKFTGNLRKTYGKQLLFLRNCIIFFINIETLFPFSCKENTSPKAGRSRGGNCFLFCATADSWYMQRLPPHDPLSFANQPLSKINGSATTVVQKPGNYFFWAGFPWPCQYNYSVQVGHKFN